MSDYNSDAERARRAEAFERLQRERSGEASHTGQKSGTSKNRSGAAAKSRPSAKQSRTGTSSSGASNGYRERKTETKNESRRLASDSGGRSSYSTADSSQQSRSRYSRYYTEGERVEDFDADSTDTRTQKHKKKEKEPIPEQHFENYSPPGKKKKNSFFSKSYRIILRLFDTDNSVSKKTVTIFVGVIVALLIVGYGYNAIKTAVNKSKIPDTDTALLTKIDVGIEADAYFIRKETVIDVTAGTTVVPTVSDGSKVGIGDTVANVYTSEAAAKAAATLSDLEDKLSYYENIAAVSSGKNLSSYSVYNANVNENLLAMQKLIQSGDVSSISEYGYEFSENLTKRQIATGQSVDVTEAIASVNAEIASVKAAATVSSTVTTPAAGCFMNFTDGYETVGDYSNVKNFTKTDVEALMNAAPTESDTNKVGKLVHEFVWYAVCNLSKQDAENLTVGRKTTVTVDGYSGGSLSLTVEAKNQNDDDTVTVVFSSDDLNSDTAQLRKEHINILKASYTGYAVDIKALRTQDDEQGVFVLVGKKVEFKKVQIVYNNEDYALVTGDSTKSGYIKLYDEVIIKGTDYNDGDYIE
jgi:hypothetical protein